MSVDGRDVLPREQQRLRRARVLEALQVPLAEPTVLGSRGPALSALLIRADSNDVAFDLAPDELIDLSVSLASSAYSENAFDGIRTLALCVHALVRDGQFARVRHMSDRLRALAELVQMERPFLSAYLDSLAAHLAGRIAESRGGLDRALGLRHDVGRLYPQSSDNLSDLLLCAAWRAWGSEGDTQLREHARRLSIDRFDDLTLLLLDLSAAYASAFDFAALKRTVQAAHPSFRANAFNSYFERVGVSILFPAQLRAVNAGVLENSTRVLGLPTSSGKTLLAELRIAAVLGVDPEATAIYVSPYRLLSRQVETTFRQHLRPLHIRVEDLGAAFDATEGPERQPLQPQQAEEAAAVEDVRVAIMTPERLDGLMRLSRSTRPGSDAAKALLNRTKVLIFDEVQLIARPGRGPRFEVLISRIRDRFPSLPILGLSALATGVDYLATWLGDDNPVIGGRRPTGTLEVVWEESGSLFLRQAGTGGRHKIGELPRRSTAIESAADLALRFSSEYMPVLVVETQRGWAESVAERIRALRPSAGTQWRQTLPVEARRDLDAAAEEVRRVFGAQHRLADLLQQGVAYHHAGVPSGILRHIEGLARNRALRAVVSTTTVAEGADLPFRVVILPHLNFPSGPLDRELYQNLIGRAGRAGVALEGMVFVLGSNARTLRRHVHAELWSEEPMEVIQGRLHAVTTRPTTFADRETYRNVESQILSWLDELPALMPDPAPEMSLRSFTWLTSSDRDRAATTALIEACIQNLLEKGMLAEAGLGFRLTALGHRVRLAGLSVASCRRLDQLLGANTGRWVDDLRGTTELGSTAARQLSWLAFQTEEVLEQGLWTRRLEGTDASRFQRFQTVIDGSAAWPDDQTLFDADVSLLAGWISGESYVELGAKAPVFQRGLFAKGDASERASDAADYMASLTYPASWAWAGTRVLLEGRGDELPQWLRPAIEAGVRTETAATLVSLTGVSRDGAMRVSDQVGPAWKRALETFDGWGRGEFAGLGLTYSDTERVLRVVA